MKRTFLSLGAALMLVPGVGLAEGFSSGYVTGFNTEADCMREARNSLNAHFGRYGVTPDIGEATYSVFGFDVPPGPSQIAIICSVDQGRVTSTVTGYSLNENGSRLQTVEDLLDLLEGQPVPGSGSGGGSK